jgi:hypothetical protein
MKRRRRGGDGGEGGEGECGGGGEEIELIWRSQFYYWIRYIFYVKYEE